MENIIAYLQANQFVTSLLVLPIILAVNIYLGYALADFKGEMDKNKLILGIKKGVAVYVAIGSLSGIAQVLTVSEIDLIPTVKLIVYIVTVSYIIQVVDKIKTVLNFKQAQEVVRPEVTE